MGFEIVQIKVCNLLQLYILAEKRIVLDISIWDYLIGTESLLESAQMKCYIQIILQACLTEKVLPLYLQSLI